MYKKFEINRTKIKGGCQSGRKVVLHDSKSDLPLRPFRVWQMNKFYHFYPGPMCRLPPTIENVRNFIGSIEFQSKWGEFFRGPPFRRTSKRGWTFPVHCLGPTADWCPMLPTFRFIWEPCKARFDIKWISWETDNFTEAMSY